MEFFKYPVIEQGRRQWRWRLEAANHEPISSGEAYVHEQDCDRAIELVKSTNWATPVKLLQGPPGGLLGR